MLAFQISQQNNDNNKKKDNADAVGSNHDQGEVYNII